MSEIDGLTLLGQAKTDYPDAYAPHLLERFSNRYPQHDYEVELDCPEFTCLCPITGQPDFARITIRYSPQAYSGRIEVAETVSVQLPQSGSF
jgi:7-cyano-7-deazaguanine reductase